MKHFAIYHSVSKRGPVIEWDDTEPFAILTDRPVRAAVGNQVWLISGAGKPAIYRVHYAFTALDSESGEDEGFKHRLWGLNGVRFTPPVRIDRELWFSEFATSQGNFAFGLSPINDDQTLEGLARLVADHPFQTIDLELATDTIIAEPTYPDEVPSHHTYVDGAVRQVLVNAYERDPAARAACIQHYGCQCMICDFDFGAFYGDLGTGFIHVHHRQLVSAVGYPHEIDPVRDLIPVCPNCHAMLHTGTQPPTVEELKVICDSNTNTDADCS